MPQGTLIGLLCKLLQPTHGKVYTFLLIQLQARSPAQDTEGASEARGLTVTSSQIWSLFLLGFIYSFVYFREILPREQVRLSVWTPG